MEKNQKNSLWFRMKDFITNPKVAFFLLVSIFFLNLFDGGVSWWIISAGYAYELNPIMAYLMSISFPLFFAVKFIMGTILFQICRTKIHEPLVAKTIFILFVFYFLLGLYNCFGIITVLPHLLNG